MKKFINTIFCSVLILSVIYSTAYGDTIKIAVGDFCPYQCVPEKEDGKIGFMSEFTRLIFQKAGHTVVFKLVPFKRAILETEEGKYDAVVCNTGHSTQLIFSKKQIAVLEQLFFVKKGNPWTYKGVKSLESIIVGSIIGYNLSSMSPEYEAYLQKNANTNAVEYISANNGILRNARMILAERITTYNEDAALFRYATMKAGIGDEFVTAGKLGENPLYIGFSPNNPNSQRYVQIFDSGIKALRESGELDSILARYGGEDWEQ